MKAEMIYDTAVMLAGRDIYNEYIEDNDYQRRRAVFLINQVMLELSQPMISSLEQNITANPKFFDALCYGTARLIAVSACDSVTANTLTETYNAKRAAALCSITRVKNRIPV